MLGFFGFLLDVVVFFEVVFFFGIWEVFVKRFFFIFVEIFFCILFFGFSFSRVVINYVKLIVLF